MSIIFAGKGPYEVKSLGDHMSDMELFAFCQENKELRIERDKQRNIIIMTPVGSKSGFYEHKLNLYLGMWNEQHGLGIAFSPSAGFLLPDGSMRSPGASWIPLERWCTIPEEERKGFPEACPNFIAEIRSESDSLADFKSKMLEWINNGAQLGWLIDPREKMVYIYRSDLPVETIEGFDQALSGEDTLPGFSLPLSAFEIPE